MYSNKTFNQTHDHGTEEGTDLPERVNRVKRGNKYVKLRLEILEMLSHTRRRKEKGKKEESDV